MSEPKEPSPALACAAQDGSGLPEGWLQVQSMDLDAQGVARRADGKVVFIDGALPSEWVSASTYRKKNHWEQANLTAIHRESAQRVRPGCPHFGLHAGACGGCKMQPLRMGGEGAGGGRRGGRGGGRPLRGPPVRAPCDQEGRGAGGFS